MHSSKFVGKGVVLYSATHNIHTHYLPLDYFIFYNFLPHFLFITWFWDCTDGNKYKGGIYMVFEYMDHDLTGLADRPGMRFTVPQIKVCQLKCKFIFIY